MSSSGISSGAGRGETAGGAPGRRAGEELRGEAGEQSGGGAVRLGMLMLRLKVYAGSNPSLRGERVARPRLGDVLGAGRSVLVLLFGRRALGFDRVRILRRQNRSNVHSPHTTLVIR